MGMGITARALSRVKKGKNILKMLTYLNLVGFLWPAPSLVKDGDSFDFVIVGGGTAGCILASNLVKLNATVALIEAGEEPTFETLLPRLLTHLKSTDFDWNFTSIHGPDPYQKSTGEIQQGKVLGGSGQVNYMIYSIGNRQDYEGWATLTNDSSWSLKELCPLIKRTEKVIDKEILNSPEVFFHGTKGKLLLKKYHTEINEDYFESYKELGYNVVRDVHPNNTFGYTNAFFSIGHGVRQSTAYAFLSSVKDNPNLYLMLNSLATKIVFDENKNAVGVRVFTKDKKYITVKAKKEVIITAGTIKSPHLLMLSGIGPKKHLESKGIKVISDLPVGQNFHDHESCVLVYKMGKSKPASPLNPFEFPAALIDGYVAINESQGFPDYQILSGVLTDPKYFLEICGISFNYKNCLCDQLYKSVAGHLIYFVTHHLLYPDSRGQILLKSKDPKANPLIYPRYYSNEKDLERHAEYVDHYNAVLNTTFYKSVNAELIDPKFETCHGLERGTNAYWKCFILGMRTSLHNYVGTCAMGSVVDSKLRVIGVKNVRIADASIMPKIVGSTVQATVMIIAQKLTDILVKHHKLCS